MHFAKKHPIDKPVYVTTPFLAPLEEYNNLLKSVWDRGILTHNGPVVQEFEKIFCDEFNTQNMVAVSNGTIALQMAIKALGLEGEIITSPFTWIATISAIKWEGCSPVFVDIDPESLNIDPSKIEEKITDRTVAIMPIHVFGNPCNVIEIERIAKKHNLKVIYDAAHAVGSKFQNRSLLEYGDITATSFHATKLLNTAEGGGCITTDNQLHEKLKRIRFFGHDDTKDIVEDGFNGKMTEVHAALGISNLKYIDSVIQDRKRKYQKYLTGLEGIEELNFQKIEINDCNCSYFPIIFKNEDLLQISNRALNDINIFPRRYFYPSVNTFRKVVNYEQCRFAEDISERILCLPLYYSLPDDVIDRVISVIREVSGYD